MNISYNWLKEFINLELTPEETAEKLTLIGLEVEGIEPHGSLLEGVVVGEVLDVRKHPNADRLRLCDVSLGEERVQIVCGADNVAKGQKVPVATVGTTLPVKLNNGDFLTIKKAKLRGEESRGMICAEDELGLGTGHDGIMVLDDQAKTGAPLSEVLDLYTDTVIDIAITPNRPDATCHLGVARDLAAALNLKLEKPFETEYKEAAPIDDYVAIEIKNPEKCHRYVGKAVRGVTIGESPSWLKNRLLAIGVRPVNNVVDVTNYVMYELGQPLHAFDMDTIRGNKIIVRDFDEAIEFETLDHVKRACPAGTLFICDEEGPVAIAGVMGGVNSEVSDTTTNILLESAYFDPGSTRRAAKQQALNTDASYRFERGVDPNLQRIAAERAASLIADLAGGTVVDGCTDIHPVQTEPLELNLRKSYTNRLLGTDLSVPEIKELLNGLEFEAVAEDQDSITYRVPTFRPDLEREVDLIEEVGRLYDYNNIKAPEHSRFASPEAINEWEQLQDKARQTAKELRFREIYTNSLLPENDAGLFGSLDQMVHTLNPISKDMTTLRPSLLHGFLTSASYNFNRNIKEVRFFEVGHVFNKSDEGTYFPNIKEESRLLLGISGLRTIEHWKTEPEAYDIFDLKASVTTFLSQLGLEEHADITVADNGSLKYTIDDIDIAELAAVDSSLLEKYEIEYPAFVAEFSLNKIFQVRSGLPAHRYEPVPRYPSFEFDFAVIVESGVLAGDLLREIRNEAGKSLTSLQVFDVFEGGSLGENKKSLAFRLSFIDKNKTLTINDVEPIINKVVKALEQRYSAKLRS